MTATATGNAAAVPTAAPAATSSAGGVGHGDQATETPGRSLSAALYDLVLGVERHRVHLARELHLGTTDVAALWEIARTPGLRPGELARALGLGDAGTSSVVDKLVKAGFARRVPHPTDRRSLNLELTPAGRHAHAWIEDEIACVVVRALPEDLTAAQLIRLATQFATPRPCEPA